MTHYLRFPDADTGMKALDDAGLLDADQNPITASHGHALDVVGEIFETVGWHINYIGDIPEDWEQYFVNPENPYRVFL